MSQIKKSIEQLQYSIDVLKEYVCDIDENIDVNKMFALGKIAAAFEEVRIHYNCLYDDIFSEEIDTNTKTVGKNLNFSDTISNIGAADYFGTDRIMFSDAGDYIRFDIPNKDNN